MIQQVFLNSFLFILIMQHFLLLDLLLCHIIVSQILDTSAAQLAMVTKIVYNLRIIHSKTDSIIPPLFFSTLLKSCPWENQIFHYLYNVKTHYWTHYSVLVKLIEFVLKHFSCFFMDVSKGLILHLSLKLMSGTGVYSRPGGLVHHFKHYYYSLLSKTITGCSKYRRIACIL